MTLTLPNLPIEASEVLEDTAGMEAMGATAAMEVTSSLISSFTFGEEHSTIPCAHLLIERR